MFNHLRNPGFYFLIMWWWFMVFFVMHLLRHPVSVYFFSYIRYFGAVIIIGVFAFALGFLNARSNFWERLKLWGKFFVLVGSYVFGVLLVLINSTLMESYMSAKFFGLANDSDFEMVCIPSVVIYFIVGIVFVLIVSISRKFRQKN